MLSRVANSIHWMSRYIERAENVARFLDVVHHLVLDLPGGGAEQWQPLVEATGDEYDFTERYGEANQPNVTRFLTFDRQNPNSIASCMHQARENARSIREIISLEMWEQVNRTYLMVREAEDAARVEDDPAAFFSHFKKACHLFVGSMHLSMTYGDAWHFARLGQLLERADKTSRQLDARYILLAQPTDDVAAQFENIQWSALLKSLSAFEMYRKRFHQMTPRGVADFLILDPEFPRSMHFCLAHAEQSLRQITGSEPYRYASEAEQQLGRLHADLAFSDIDDVLGRGAHEFLDEFQLRLNAVGQAIHDTFFDVRFEADPAAPRATEQVQA